MTPDATELQRIREALKEYGQHKPECARMRLCDSWIESIHQPCTCHPDDSPPRPCPRKYALSECRAAIQPEQGKYTGLYGVAQLFAEHVAQNAQPERREVGLPQGVECIDDRRLCEIMSGYADFPAPDYFEINSLAYEVRNWRLLSAQTGVGLTDDDRQACLAGAKYTDILADKTEQSWPIVTIMRSVANRLRNIAARGRTPL